MASMDLRVGVSQLVIPTIKIQLRLAQAGAGDMFKLPKYEVTIVARLNAIFSMAVILTLGLNFSVHAQSPQFASVVKNANDAAPLPDLTSAKAAAVAKLQAAKQAVGECAPTGVRFERPEPATADALFVKLIQAGKIKNAWMVYGVAEGCPGAEKGEYVILLKNDGGVQMERAHAGESLASFSQIRDALPQAQAAAQLYAGKNFPGCTSSQVRLLHTGIKSQSPDLGPDFYGVRYKGTWNEIWVYGICGKKVDIPVDFQADGSGGAYFQVKTSAAQAEN